MRNPKTLKTYTNLGKKTKKKQPIARSISNICSFEETGNEIDDDTIIITISLFKLDSMYKDITAYLDGLTNIISYVEKLNREENRKLHIFLYYDHSLDYDEKFLEIKNNIIADIKNKKSCVSLFEYKCPEFIDPNNKIHLGLFGTFIRFYPMFIKKYEKNIKMISDSDFTDLESLFVINYIPKALQKTSNKFLVVQKIGYEWKYKNLFINKYLNGTAFAWFGSKNYTIPLTYMEPFLLDLLDKNKKSKIYQNVSNLFGTIVNSLKNKMESDKDNVKVTTQLINKYNNYHTFAYGIDELFLNLYLIDKVMDDLGKIGVIYVSDVLRLYPLEMIDWVKSNVHNLQQFLKDFLHESYPENVIRTKYNMISNRIYNKINIDTVSNYYDYKNNEKNLNQFYKLITKYNDSKKIIIDQKYLENLELHTRTHNKSSITLLYKKDKHKNNYKLLDTLLKNTQVYTIYKQNKYIK